MIILLQAFVPVWYPYIPIQSPWIPQKASMRQSFHAPRSPVSDGRFSEPSMFTADRALTRLALCTGMARILFIPCHRMDGRNVRSTASLSHH